TIPARPKKRSRGRESARNQHRCGISGRDAGPRPTGRRAEVSFSSPCDNPCPKRTSPLCPLSLGPLTADGSSGRRPKSSAHLPANSSDRSGAFGLFAASSFPRAALWKSTTHKPRSGVGALHRTLPRVRTVVRKRRLLVRWSRAWLVHFISAFDTIAMRENGNRRRPGRNERSRRSDRTQRRTVGQSPRDGFHGAGGS